jgi:hypothetical protein
MKKIIGTIGLWLCINLLSAQTQSSNEWSIRAGAGNATLQYNLSDPDNGTVESGIGESLGVNYTHFFSSYFGFSLGLEASMYNSSLIINNLNTVHLIETPPGLEGAFLLTADYSDVEEKQTAYFLQLPVMLQFQVPLGRSAFFYLGTGIKWGMPVSVSYNQNVHSITTTGYSFYTAQTYQDMPNHGFGTNYNIDSSDKFALKTPCMLSVEGGFKWKISKKNALFTGVYLDYGLNNIQKESSKELLEYNSVKAPDYHYNSMLQTAIVNEIKPFAIGIKISIAFGGGKQYTSGKKEPKPVKSKPIPILGY